MSKTSAVERALKLYIERYEKTEKLTFSVSII